MSPDRLRQRVLGPTAEDLDDKRRHGVDRRRARACSRQGGADRAGARRRGGHRGLRGPARRDRARRLPDLRRTRPSATSASAASARPGLTASMAIAEYVLDGSARRGSRRSAAAPDPRRVRMPNLGEACPRPYQRAERDRRATRTYGAIVCHCERVTRGEIRDALASPIPPADLDGLRRRTARSLGRCQGFYLRRRWSRALARGDGRSARWRRVTPGRDAPTSLVVGGGPGRARGRRRARARAAWGASSCSSASRRRAASRATPPPRLRPARPAARVRPALRAPLRRAGRARRRRASAPETTATGWTGPRHARAHEPGRAVRASPRRAVVLATGCRERPRVGAARPGHRPRRADDRGSSSSSTCTAARVGRRAVVVGAEHVSFSACSPSPHGGARTVAMVTEQPRHQTLGAFRVGAALRCRVPSWTRTRGHRRSAAAGASRRSSSPISTPAPLGRVRVRHGRLHRRLDPRPRARRRGGLAHGPRHARRRASTPRCGPRGPAFSPPAT